MVFSSFRQLYLIVHLSLNFVRTCKCLNPTCTQRFHKENKRRRIWLEIDNRTWQKNRTERGRKGKTQKMGQNTPPFRGVFLFVVALFFTPNLFSFSSLSSWPSSPFSSSSVTIVEAFGKAGKGGSCSNPGEPWQGFIESLNRNHGGQVTFGCNSEYKLVGDQSRTCKNGVWTGEQPRCVVMYDPSFDGRWDFNDEDSLVKDDDWWLMTDEAGDKQRAKEGTTVTFGR